jgi:hypothetical protein
MRSWPFRIGALVLCSIVLSSFVLSGIVLYGTASLLLPLTAVLMLSGIMLYGIVLYGTASLLLPRTPVRIRVLVLSGIVLFGIVLDGTAYNLLPRTANSVSVTVVQCATVQPVHQDSGLDCQGTTVFRRTFTDEATVSAVHAALDGLHEEVAIFANINCNAGSLCTPTQVYSFDLLWHGRVVRSYRTSVPDVHVWAVRTLGLELWAAGDSTTWQDVVRERPVCLSHPPVCPRLRAARRIPAPGGRGRSTQYRVWAWPRPCGPGAHKRQPSNANRYQSIS